MKKALVTLNCALIVFLTTTTIYAKNNTKTNNLIKKSLAKMVYIPSGTYIMGPSNPNWQAGNDTPPHKVHLSSFYISRYNVSYGQYDAFTQAENKPFIQNTNRTKLWNFARNSVHPVSGITWYQADNYCEWLAKKTGLPYSLPTEAQWEYVARDLGKKGWAFATNNGKQELGKNFPDEKMYDSQKYNAGGVDEPLPVGSLPCTPMGICGMGGEVNQWVKDWYSPTYYAHSPVDNPQGPKTGTLKVLRSGSSEGSPSFANNFGRSGIKPTTPNGGFRCVINSDLPMSKLTAIAKKHLQG